MRRRLLLLALLAIAIALPSRARAQAPADSAEVHAALTDFLHAFENLDWDRFRAAFADSVTVFFPAPEPPEGYYGRDAVETHFLTVFQAIRRTATSGPPFQTLPPVRLAITMLGPDAALATFELHNAERTGRRTVVFRRERGRWRIVHLHASNAAL